GSESEVAVALNCGALLFQVFIVLGGVCGKGWINTEERQGAGTLHIKYVVYIRLKLDLPKHKSPFKLRTAAMKDMDQIQFANYFPVEVKHFLSQAGLDIFR